MIPKQYPINSKLETLTALHKRAVTDESSIHIKELKESSTYNLVLKYTSYKSEVPRGVDDNNPPLCDRINT